MNKIVIIIVFGLFSGFARSQDFGVGSWREHLPYNNVVSIAQVGTITYAATEFALFSIDEDENVERINKINALSDLSINVIQENSSQNALVIGYQSGNIDIIKNGDVINLSSILISNIVGDKAIYNIHNDGQYAYLAWLSLFVFSGRVPSICIPSLNHIVSPLFSVSRSIATYTCDRTRLLFPPPCMIWHLPLTNINVTLKYIIPV